MSNLKLIREAKGLTQREVAEAAGVSFRSYQHYEQGERDLNKTQVDTVCKIAKVLGCTAEELISTETLDEKPQTIRLFLVLKMDKKRKKKYISGVIRSEMYPSTYAVKNPDVDIVELPSIPAEEGYSFAGTHIYFY